MSEEQVKTIPGYIGELQGGNLDGGCVIVVAWKPTPDELIDLAQGKPVFLSCIGGLPPHFLSTSFEAATFQTPI